MAFKLIQTAQARWRAVNAQNLVALLRNGATFKHGKLVERPTHPHRSRSSRGIVDTSHPQVLTIAPVLP
jgi:hypothetical protein